MTTAMLSPVEAASELDVLRDNNELEQLFHRLGDLASLPAIAQQVLIIANKPDASIDEMQSVIEQDPALTIRILKTVNSAYYGLQNEIADLKSAIVHLGITPVRNLAMTVVVAKHFSRPHSIGEIDPQRLWDHSVCVAAAARKLATLCPHVEPEEAYLAGLIHDIGLSVVGQYLDQQSARIMVRFKTGRDWLEAEREILSFGHTDLGAYLAMRSGFPDRMWKSVLYHHEPHDAAEEVQRLVSLVMLANYYVTRMGRGSISGRRLVAPPADLLDNLEITRKQLADQWPHIEEVLSTVGGLKNC